LRILPLLAVTLIASFTFAQAEQQVAAARVPHAGLSVGGGDKALESELVGNEQRLADSEKSKDAQFLQQALADDFIYVAYNGLVFTKDRIVKDLQYIDINEYRMENFKVRVLSPDAALLTHDLMVQGAIGGHDLPRRQYASSVWVRKGDHWIAVLHQETPARHP
jgi:hypothetical protein